MISKIVKPAMFAILLIFVTVTNLQRAKANGANIINGWIENTAQSGFLKVSADSVNFNSDTNITLVTNLALKLSVDPQAFNFAQKAEPKQNKGNQNIAFTLRFPIISFNNLTGDRAYYSATKVTAQKIDLIFDVDVDVDVDVATQKNSSKGSYTNFVAADLTWAKLPAVKHNPAMPVSQYFPVVKALSDISFSFVRADKLEIVQKTIEPEMVTTTTYNEMVYKNAKHGDIAFSSVASTEFSGDSQPFSFNVNIGPITIADYKIGAIINNFAPNIAPQENGPYKPVIGKISVGKTNVKFNQGQMSIDEMTWQDVSVRPTPVSFLKTLDKLITNKFAPKETIPLWIGDLVRSSYGAFKLGKSEVKGVTFNIDGFVGKLDSVVLENFSSDGIGAHVLSGFTITKSNEFDVSIGRMNTRNLKFPALKDILQFEQAQKRNDISAMLKAMPTLDEFLVENVKANIPQQGIFGFEYASFNMADHIGPIPTKIATSLKNLVLPAAILGREAQTELKKLGYETLKLSYADKMTWNKSSNTMDISTTLNVNDGGSYDFAATLGNIPKLIFTSPAAAPGLLIGATFNKASFNFKDDSIIDRLFRKFAKEENVEVATLKDSVLNAFRSGLSQLKNPQFAAKATAAMRQLLNNKGSITLTARPNKPASIVGLYSEFDIAPETIVDRLNIEIDTK